MDFEGSETKEYNTNYKIWEEFVMACSMGDLEKCRRLIIEENVSPYTDDSKGFIEACRYGHLNIVQYYMENEPYLENKNHFVNCHHSSALQAASSKGHVHILQYLESLKPDGLILTYTFGCINSANDSGVERKQYKEVIEFIVYETDFEPTEEMINVFNPIYEENQFVASVFANRHIMKERKKLHESLKQDLPITNPTPPQRKI